MEKPEDVENVGVHEKQHSAIKGGYNLRARRNMVAVEHQEPEQNEPTTSQGGEGDVTGRSNEEEVNEAEKPHGSKKGVPGQTVQAGSSEDGVQTKGPGGSLFGAVTDAFRQFGFGRPEGTAESSSETIFRDEASQGVAAGEQHLQKELNEAEEELSSSPQQEPKDSEFVRGKIPEDIDRGSLREAERAHMSQEASGPREAEPVDGDGTQSQGAKIMQDRCTSMKDSAVKAQDRRELGSSAVTTAHIEASGRYTNSTSGDNSAQLFTDCRDMPRQPEEDGKRQAEGDTAPHSKTDSCTAGSPPVDVGSESAALLTSESPVESSLPPGSDIRRADASTLEAAGAHQSSRETDACNNSEAPDSLDPPPHSPHHPKSHSRSLQLMHQEEHASNLFEVTTPKKRPSLAKSRMGDGSLEQQPAVSSVSGATDGGQGKYSSGGFSTASVMTPQKLKQREELLKERERTGQISAKLQSVIREKDALEQDNLRLVAETNTKVAELYNCINRQEARSKEKERKLMVEIDALQRDKEALREEAQALRAENEEMRAEYEEMRGGWQAQSDELERLHRDILGKSDSINTLVRLVEERDTELMQQKKKAGGEIVRSSSALHAVKNDLMVLRGCFAQLAQDAHAGIKLAADANGRFAVSVSGAVDNLLREQAELKKRYAAESKERRHLYNQVLELKGNIRVFCRCRPLGHDDMAAGRLSVTEFENSRDGGDLFVRTSAGIRKSFKFDRAFAPNVDQGEVFEDTAPVVTSVLDGYNVCIFAYGQTGTGKTYTMEGLPHNRGVNFRTLEELFRVASYRTGQVTYKFAVSVLEVYNEQIRDLLGPPLLHNQPAKKLEVKQAIEGGHHIPGLLEAPVHTVQEVWEVLQKGARNRSTGATNANEHSSRSHCMVCVMVRGESHVTGEATRSKLWLVDLAGSERVAKSEAAGERMKEAQAINKSLSALGDVIHALSTKSPHIPYRNSKLTHILQDSLGGDSKTLMFVQISPSEADVSETLCSLAFASRVKGVELGPARKQTDSGELFRYKQLAEKVKGEARVKEEAARRAEESLKAAEAKLKAKDHMCQALTDKAKEASRTLQELEHQLAVEQHAHLAERQARVAMEEKLKEQRAVAAQALADAREAQGKAVAAVVLQAREATAAVAQVQASSASAAATAVAEAERVVAQARSAALAGGLYDVAPPSMNASLDSSGASYISAATAAAIATRPGGATGGDATGGLLALSALGGGSGATAGAHGLPAGLGFGSGIAAVQTSTESLFSLRSGPSASGSTSSGSQSYSHGSVEMVGCGAASGRFDETAAPRWWGQEGDEGAEATGGSRWVPGAEPGQQEGGAYPSPEDHHHQQEQQQQDQHARVGILKASGERRVVGHDEAEHHQQRARDAVELPPGSGGGGPSSSSFLAMPSAQAKARAVPARYAFPGGNPAPGTPQNSSKHPRRLVGGPQPHLGSSLKPTSTPLTLASSFALSRPSFHSADDGRPSAASGARERRSSMGMRASAPITASSGLNPGPYEPHGPGDYAVPVSAGATIGSTPGGGFRPGPALGRPPLSGLKQNRPMDYLDRFEEYKKRKGDGIQDAMGAAPLAGVLPGLGMALGVGGGPLSESKPPRTVSASRLAGRTGMGAQRVKTGKAATSRATIQSAPIRPTMISDSRERSWQ